MGVPTTQKAWVLARLKDGAALTPFDAASVGILRLGAIIFDLRQEGYVIRDLNAGFNTPNGRYGRAERFSAYQLMLRPGDA